MLRTNRTARSGFTLIELMIAAAITVMIMTILSICFQTSMSAMSAMRAQGDAADQLRALGGVMKRDFKADRHLPAEGSTMVLNRGRRISDYPLNFGAPAPATGFFYIDSPPSTAEGNDGSFDSSRNAPNATYTLGTRLWMTSVLPGGDDNQLFTAMVGGPVLSSEAAEIAYFLVQTGQTTGTPSLPLFNLHRRVRLVATDSNRRAALDPYVAAYPDRISRNQSVPGQANTMDSIALGGRSPTTGPNAIFNALGTGDDIILSNVLSFEVKPTWTHSNFLRDPVPFNGRAAAAGYPAYGQNHDFPYDDLTKASNSTAQYTFDSLGGMPVRMNAMQIRIRIYDLKVKTARQMTLVVDL